MAAERHGDVRQAESRRPRCHRHRRGTPERIGSGAGSGSTQSPAGVNAVGPVRAMATPGMAGNPIASAGTRLPRRGSAPRLAAAGGRSPPIHRAPPAAPQRRHRVVGVARIDRRAAVSRTALPGRHAGSRRSDRAARLSGQRHVTLAQAGSVCSNEAPFCQYSVAVLVWIRRGSLPSPRQQSAAPGRSRDRSSPPARTGSRSRGNRDPRAGCWCGKAGRRAGSGTPGRSRRYAPARRRRHGGRPRRG